MVNRVHPIFDNIDRVEDYYAQQVLSQILSKPQIMETMVRVHAPQGQTQENINNV